MSVDGYKIRDQQAVHFITFATVQWIDVFTRSDYVNIVIDSIAYCQKEKGLLLHLYWRRDAAPTSADISAFVGAIATSNEAHPTT